MKRHLRISASLFLAVSLVLVGAAPATFAATKSIHKVKTAAKPTEKPKAKSKASQSKSTVKPKAKSKASQSKPSKPLKKPTPNGNDPGRFNRFATLTTVQRACLVKQGITIPAPRSSNAPRPTPNPSRPPGGFGVGGNFNPTKLTAAYKACGIALPKGGFAFDQRGAFNPAKFQAFQKCMTAAGFTPTGGFGRYDESDPSTVAALVKCQKKTGFTMPKRGQPGASN